MAKGKGGARSRSASGERAQSPRKGGGDRPGVRIRWERRNVTLLSAGLAAVALGYILLSQGDVTAAPLLLVAGYCVLVPLAFIL